MGGIRRFMKAIKLLMCRFDILISACQLERIFPDGDDSQERGAVKTGTLFSFSIIHYQKPFTVHHRSSLFSTVLHRSSLFFIVLQCSWNSLHARVQRSATFFSTCITINNLPTLMDTPQSSQWLCITESLEAFGTVYGSKWETGIEMAHSKYIEEVATYKWTLPTLCQCLRSVFNWFTDCFCFINSINSCIYSLVFFYQFYFVWLLDFIQTFFVFCYFDDCELPLPCTVVRPFF